MNRLMRLCMSGMLLALFSCAWGETPEPAKEGSVALLHGSASGYSYAAGESLPAADHYWAVVCRKQTCTLDAAQVSITTEPYLGYDTLQGQTGPVLRTSSPLQSLFVVGGIPGLTAGPLKTWYVNERFNRDPGQVNEIRITHLKKDIDIDGRTLSLQGSLLQQPGQCEACLLRVAWKMKFGETERTLVVLENSELGVTLDLDDLLIWAGDIDGDGRPDLLLRPQDRTDYLELALFLSSTLKPGQPWRRSGHFYWWDPHNAGC